MFSFSIIVLCTLFDEWVVFCYRKPSWRSSCPYDSNNYRQKEKSYFPPRQKDERSYLLMDPDKYFPNEIENDFNHLKSRNYFPSSFDTSTDNWMARRGTLKGKYFVELAIFIDRDLYRIMSENFPVDTEEHIIQVVLAMINAVGLILLFLRDDNKKTWNNSNVYLKCL